MLSRYVVEQLCLILKTAGQGIHDPRQLFTYLDKLKDNKNLEKGKRWDLEQVLESNVSYSQMPESISSRLDETVETLKKDGFDLKFDAKFQIIRERRFNPETGEEIVKPSETKDLSLKYIWIKGALNGESVDLVITRYAANTNYRTYLKDKFFGDVSSNDKLKQLFEAMVKGKVSPKDALEDLEKILVSKKGDLDRELHHLFRNFDPAVEWNIVLAKPTKIHPVFRIGVILKSPLPDKPFDKKEVLSMLRNIDPIRKSAQNKVESFLKQDYIDLNNLNIKSNTFDNFDKTPGFFISVSFK